MKTDATVSAIPSTIKIMPRKGLEFSDLAIDSSDEAEAVSGMAMIEIMSAIANTMAKILAMFFIFSLIIFSYIVSFNL